MGVKLKGQVTAADVAKLRDIHRQLQSLGFGLHPAAPASVSLTAALWTVRTVIRHWSGGTSTSRRVRLSVSSGRPSMSIFRLFANDRF